MGKKVQPIGKFSKSMPGFGGAENFGTHDVFGFILGGSWKRLKGVPKMWSNNASSPVSGYQMKRGFLARIIGGSKDQDTPNLQDF